jgi:hypothetical protein
MTRKMTVVMAVGLLALNIMACASTPSVAAASIVETDEKGVEQCTFLGLVSGSSMLGGAVQERARENAKTAALEDAAKKGATHIVWTDVHSTSQNGASAQGRAYRCKP